MTGSTIGRCPVCLRTTDATASCSWCCSTEISVTLFDAEALDASIDLEAGDLHDLSSSNDIPRVMISGSPISRPVSDSMLPR